MNPTPPRNTMQRLIPWAIPALLAVALLPAAAGLVLGGDSPSKLERQIGVMERAIDDMLVDSPNFLVSGKHVTQGVEADDSGVLFLFSASLTDWWWSEDGRRTTWNFWPFDRKHRIIISGDEDEDGNVVALDDGEIIIKNGKVTIRGDDGKVVELNSDLEKPDRKSRQERQLDKYNRAKAEIVTVLMDYGEVMKALPSGQTVKIIARMRDLDLPSDKDVRKLSVSAKIDDLRAYADGKITEEQMRQRVEVKES